MSEQRKEGRKAPEDVPVIQRTHLARLEPSVDAVEVEGVL